MNLLIDTHILLWYIMGDERVSPEVLLKIENNSNTIFLSNVSLWEIAIKVSIGKLKLKVSFSELKSFLGEKGIFILEFDFNDLEELQNLPFFHQDPFDRMIIAQAKTKNLEIITDDEKVKKYF